MLTVKDLLLDHLQQTYEKEGWYPPLGLAVKGLTAEQAAWQPSPERHSIWQIVRHVIHWKRGVLQSWAGDPPDFEQLNRDDWPEASGDETAWQADVQALNEIYAEFRRKLEATDDEGIQASVLAYQQSHQQTLIAKRLSWVFTHDAYHAGQIQYLRALQGIPADRFFTAAWSGDVAKMHDVMEEHPELLNAYNREGWTALQLAAYLGQADAVRFLLERGAVVGIKSRNDMANTALHGAIAGKRTDVVPLLLEHGADPDATDSSGNTALHLAAHEGVPEILELVVQIRANINVRRDDGKTPLGVALAENQTAAADLLRRRGGTE